MFELTKFTFEKECLKNKRSACTTADMNKCKSTKSVTD